MTCGCHLDPCGVDDARMDLCPEATEGPADRAWRIVHCAAHAGLPGLLEAAEAVLVALKRYNTSFRIVNGEDDPMFKVQADALRAAVAACEGQEPSK